MTGNRLENPEQGREVLYVRQHAIEYGENREEACGLFFSIEARSMSMADNEMEKQFRKMAKPFSDYSMRQYICFINPTVGQWILDNCTPEKGQRPLKHRHKDNMAGYMRDKHFEFTYMPLGFDENFKLRDGQHRIQALVKAGATLPFIVYFDVPISVFAWIDKGEPRNSVAQRAVLETSIDYGHDDPYTSKSQKITRNMMIGLGSLGNQFLTHELLDFFDDHHEAVAWVENYDPVISQHAPILAAVGRAYEHVDLRLLDRFCKILIDCRLNGGLKRKDKLPEDSAAYCLYKWVFKSINDKQARHFMYGKTTWAIDRFVKREEVEECLSTIEDLFPIL